jgi:hypothetical protein
LRLHAEDTEIVERLGVVRIDREHAAVHFLGGLQVTAAVVGDGVVEQRASRSVIRILIGHRAI